MRHPIPVTAPISMLHGASARHLSQPADSSTSSWTIIVRARVPCPSVLRAMAAPERGKRGKMPGRNGILSKDTKPECRMLMNWNLLVARGRMSNLIAEQIARWWKLNCSLCSVACHVTVKCKCFQCRNINIVSPKKHSHSTNEVCQCRQMEMEKLACYILFLAYKQLGSALFKWFFKRFICGMSWLFFNEFSPRKSFRLWRATMKIKTWTVTAGVTKSCHKRNRNQSRKLLLLHTAFQLCFSF